MSLVGLVSNFQLTTSNQCENLTENHLNEFSHRWSTCQSSCSNEQFQKYLTYIKTNSLIKFYLSIGNDSNNLLNFYERILSEQFPDSIQLKSLYFNIEHEEILVNLFNNNHLLFLFINFCEKFLLNFHCFSSFFLCIITYTYYLHIFISFSINNIKFNKFKFSIVFNDIRCIRLVFMLV